MNESPTFQYLFICFYVYNLIRILFLGLLRLANLSRVARVIWLRLSFNPMRYQLISWTVEHIDNGENCKQVLRQGRDTDRDNITMTNEIREDDSFRLAKTLGQSIYLNGTQTNCCSTVSENITRSVSAPWVAHNNFVLLPNWECAKVCNILIEFICAVQCGQVKVS